MYGVIAAGGKETAAAGATILQQGGNAIDAAVAAAFASFTSEVGLVHLGGSGMAQIFDPQQGKAVVYDFFSSTPGLTLTAPLNIDFEQVTIDFGSATQDFHVGRASVAVSGNIAGLCQMAADYGRLPLSTLLTPAIEYARQGVPLTPFQAAMCQLLTSLVTHTEEIRQIFAPQGRIIQSHERLFIPHLADTLTALAAEGESFARTGRLAQAILADQAQHGGLMTSTDLQVYTVHQKEPILVPYRGYDIFLPPPSSVGGVLTAFSLNLLARLDVSQYTYASARHLQLLYEVMSATTRARPTWEKLFREYPVAEALARFLSNRALDNYYEQIQDSLHSQTPILGEAEAQGPSNTSHISIIDRDGLTVSLTTTAGESAGFVVPNTGYIPNNMLGEADLHPDGFHSRPAGERLPTMMTPTIVCSPQTAQPCFVVGSGGSTRIRSAILQVLSNLLDFQLSLDDAVNNARVHVENSILHCEVGYHPPAVDKLEALGYPINRWNKRSLYFGGAHSVSRLPDGRLVAVGDNRRDGVAANVVKLGA